MANFFSFSKIGSFENCKLQYKYKYIDKIQTDMETIEAFMGSQVHEALREFYDFVKHRVIKPKEWLIAKYDELWKKNYHDSIKIVRREYKPENYYEKGRQCLNDYYDEFKDFSQTKIVKTEENIYFNLNYQDEKFPFYGILDRVDWNDKEKIFEIHDYKTSSNLLTQQDVDNDLQLPLYHLALLSKWPEAKRTKLVWHYLLFNKHIQSYKTKQELDTIQKKVIEKIKQIQSCEEFYPSKSALCEWCDYQDICPLWKHPKKMVTLDVNEYRKDPGVKLVTEYSRLEGEKRKLKKRIHEIEEEQEKISQAAVEFAQRENSWIIDGPEKQLVVTLKEELGPPTRREDKEKWEGLRNFLIEEDKYVDVSTVNHRMLSKKLREWPQRIIEKIKKYLIRKKIQRVDLKSKS